LGEGDFEGDREILLLLLVGLTDLLAERLRSLLGEPDLDLRGDLLGDLRPGGDLRGGDRRGNDLRPGGDRLRLLGGGERGLLR